MLAFDKGKAALQRYSLIKQNRQEKTFSIHHLTQAVLIDYIAPDVQKVWRERVVGALYEAFPAQDFSDVGLSDSWQYDRLLPHVWVCTAWTEGEFTPVVDDAIL